LYVIFNSVAQPDIHIVIALCWLIKIYKLFC